jgi:alkylhydroperoxidase family enzyme
MALLPDPADHLTGADRATYDRMAQARAHAEGRPELGQVYALMFNDPEVATRVGALGGHLRFGGVLPDDVRELCILRLAVHRRVGYEWAHHQRPAEQAGLDRAIVDALTAGRTPDGLRPEQAAALRAVDAVVAGEELPASVYQQLVATWGTRGAVELVALCGLYGLIGSMITAFGIELEDGFPTPPSPPF